MNCDKLPYADYCEILTQLETCHSIFACLWSNMYPIFSDKIPTAAVVFDKDRRLINFVINKEFWDKQDLISKSFILSHEAMHLILNHGPRSLSLSQDKMKIANIAMDLVVNHTLVNHFKFNRDTILNQEQYCWVDTIFDTYVSDSLTFEEYFMMLSKTDVTNSSSDSSENNPSHDAFRELAEALGSSELANDLVREALRDFTESLGDLSKEELDSMEDAVNKHHSNVSFGSGVVGEPPIPSSIKRILTFKNIKPKKKWESIIKKWQDYTLAEHEVSQWVTEDRRFTSINSDAEVLLPQNGIGEHKDYEKISVMFFLDTSGSCYHLANRFFAAALSLDPKRFNVRLFGRCTQVKEIFIPKGGSYKDIHIESGGSDDFRCIERFIQSELASKKIKHYPHAVFHITDGGDCSGELVKPEKPKNWYWFLTGTNTFWIPKECNIFKLSDFE